jgi:uncharacterized metal-binding protein
MSQECCTENKEIMILACSGSSNLGQLANSAAVELTREGFGKMSCLAAIGAHLDNFVQSARNASNLVTIDGCPMGCARHALEHAGISLQTYVLLYDLGIEKTKDTVLDPAEVEKVKTAVRDACNGRLKTVAVNAGPSPSCCG